MANNHLGELRSSAALITFGPGSVVDFRADGAAVSAVAAGLEEWDSSFPPAGLTNPQKITEPRLQKRLAVGGFRLPPVVDSNSRDKDGNPDKRTLVAARFPQWLQCPQCKRLARARFWSDEPGKAFRFCQRCSRQTPGQRKVFVVPVRFVMACGGGHLDEFPWHFWVRHKDGCRRGARDNLMLKSNRPGLAGLILSCNSCGARRSMDGVFSSRALKGLKCNGHRPWLAADNETCDREPRALQRGASNLYFPVLVSALSIPPWSDALQQALGLFWNSIVNVDQTDRPKFVELLAQGELEPVLRELKLSPEELALQIEDRVTRYNQDSNPNIRQEEYRQFEFGTDAAVSDSEFEARNVPVPSGLRNYLSRVVRVVRLREVRVLKGFTRINPPGDEHSSDIAAIAAGSLGWLPAIEVRGEGIFLAFNQETLHRWEKQESVEDRARKIDRAWRVEWQDRYGGGKPEKRITPRSILAHTFAHALMRQLTLECGYSSAALRERLYVSEGNGGMAGLLIYTATSSSDGTLGGLQRQGTPIRIQRAVTAAIQSMEWCSSDPLCLEGLLSGSDGLSLAACHACVLAPETACEEYNRILDRVLIVGLPDSPKVGFFSPLLRNI